MTANFGLLCFDRLGVQGLNFVAFHLEAGYEHQEVLKCLNLIW